MSLELFDRLVRATLALYRVCERIPNDEPLALVIKKAALRFAAGFVMSLHAQEGRGGQRHSNDNISRQSLNQKTDVAMPPGALLRPSSSLRALDPRGGSVPPRPDVQGGYNKVNIRVSLEILCAYFLIAREEAKRHQWLDPENFLILEQEYRAIQKQMEQLRPAPKESAATVRRTRRTRLEKESTARYGKYAIPRHAELGSYIQSMQNEKFSLRDIADKFPSISSRTVRRHLQEMVRKGLLQKDGNRRTTMYYLS